MMAKVFWTISGKNENQDGRCARYDVDGQFAAITRFQEQYPGYDIVRVEWAEGRGREVAQ